MLNLGDRSVIGTVAPSLIKALHLNLAQYGVAAGAFSWGYTPVQFLAGILVIRVGAKRTWLTAMFLWSLFVALTPVAPTFAMLIAVRILFGVAEGANFPSAAALIGAWFPAKERDFASGVIGIGGSLANVVFVPLAAILSATISWQAPFFVLAALAIFVIIGVYAFVVNSPEESRLASRSEVEYVRAGQRTTAGGQERPGGRVTWRQMLLNPTVWAAGLGDFAVSWMIYIALTFIPLYFQREQHVSKAALAGVIIWPWLAYGVGAILGGLCSDWLYRRTHSIRVARGLLGGMTMIAAAAAILAVPLFGQGGLVGATVALAIAMFFINFSNTNMIAVAVDVSPADPARTGSLVFGTASLTAFLAPTVTGLLVTASGNFRSSFVVAAVCAGVGALLAFFLIRDRDVIWPAGKVV